MGIGTRQDLCPEIGPACLNRQLCPADLGWLDEVAALAGIACEDSGANRACVTKEYVPRYILKPSPCRLWPIHWLHNTRGVKSSSDVWGANTAPNMCGTSPKCLAQEAQGLLGKHVFLAHFSVPQRHKLGSVSCVCVCVCVCVCARACVCTCLRVSDDGQWA